MKNLLLVLTIIFLGNQFSNAQLAFQGFGGTAADNWNYTPTPAFYDLGSDYWHITNSTTNIATDGANGDFVGGIDLENANNATGSTQLTFDPIAISGSVTISFRINYFGYDLADFIHFEVVYDNGTSWAAPDYTDEINALNVSGSSPGWIDVTHTVPSGPSFVRARIDIFQNGSDEIGLDHFAINTVLPIELTSFNVEAKGNFNLLSWQTANELNNDYFTCERSKDGINWESFMTVDGAGNSTAVLNYASTDETPYAGLSYYRLKQTDLDGQYYYSNIKSINVDQLNIAQINIYPNPTINQVTIEGVESELKDIRIFNIIGQEVTSLTSIIENNRNEIIIDLSNLVAGNYNIKTKNTTQKVYKK